MQSENSKPSINFNFEHGDDRRDIFANQDLLGGKEWSIIKLKKGKAIGGCFHSVDENWAVISGSVIISQKLGELIENKVCAPGDAGTFYAGNGHNMHALEDSIVLEWGVTKDEKQLNQKEPEMLQIVKDINEGKNA